MNPEKQRIKIAEACGFTQEEPWLNGKKCWAHKDYPSHIGFEEIPDYLNDLNAMHEAEKVLKGGQWDDYAFQLATVTGWNQFTNRIAVYHATAAQRQEAFLKTLGLWEDDND